MTTDQDRWQRLRDAGVITKDLPREYEAVIDGLTPFEEEAVLAMKRRLDEAGRVSGVEPGQAWLVF